MIYFCRSTSITYVRYMIETNYFNFIIFSTSYLTRTNLKYMELILLIINFLRALSMFAQKLRIHF